MYLSLYRSLNSCLYPTKLEQLQHGRQATDPFLGCLYPTKLEQLQHGRQATDPFLGCLYPTKLEQLQRENTLCYKEEVVYTLQN